MARARRSFRRRRRDMKLDWVVNEDTYGREAVITVPDTGVQAAPLTYAPFIFLEEMYAAAIVRGRSAFPEGEKQFVKAVVGQIGFTMSSWALGNSVNLMLRIVKKPQSFQTAGAIVDTGYSPFDWAHANERFAWQQLVFDVFSSANGYRNVINVRATVNQWLEPDEALYFVYANESGGNNSVTFRPYLRTLMKSAT